MIGSDTFIIVALRWTEKSTPVGLGVGDLVGEEGDERRLAHDGGVDHLAGEDAAGSFRTVVVPSVPTCSMRSGAPRAR